MPSDTSPIVPQPINGQTSGLKLAKKISISSLLFRFITAVVAIIIGVIISGVVWYNVQLGPVDNSDKITEITILDGSGSSQIGEELKNESIIKSSLAFDIYIRLMGGANLQAGTYQFNSAESIPQVVERLIAGRVKQSSVMFFPGSTIVDNTNNSKKVDISTMLKAVGYSDAEIQSALAKDYSVKFAKLFKNKPVGSSLEGYIYGETYNYNVGASVESIIESALSEYSSIIDKNDFAAKFSTQGLNLFQGITLASIIQKEANTAADQKQVAQVFYLRMKLGMPLGSDVTYQYIADKTGVARDPNLDSPYNTRRYAGLTPGPIASPGLTALQAVAEPSTGDYLYFLSGDDDVTYFAHTMSEHQSNIINHCKVKCSTL